MLQTHAEAHLHAPACEVLVGQGRAGIHCTFGGAGLGWRAGQVFTPLYPSALPCFSPPLLAAALLVAMGDQSERWDPVVLAGSTHYLPSGHCGLCGAGTARSVTQPHASVPIPLPLPLPPPALHQNDLSPSFLAGTHAVCSVMSAVDNLTSSYRRGGNWVNPAAMGAGAVEPVLASTGLVIQRAVAAAAEAGPMQPCQRCCRPALSAIPFLLEIRGFCNCTP